MTAARKRWVLLNPGPVNVTPGVRAALLGPDICHRESEFAVLLAGVRRKITGIFGVARTHSTAIFSGSGTTALESMLASFADDKKKTLVLSNGVYGERLRAILRAYGAADVFLASPIGAFPSENAIESALAKDPSIQSIAMVHHETSTGMLNPVASVARIARRRGKFFLVDAISSLGGEELDLSSVDLCAGTAGKCLHGFPGISFVLVSKRAAKALATKRRRSYSLDLLNTLRFCEKNDTPFTPAVQVLYAFDRALDELKAEGLRNRVASYRAKSALLANGMKKLGIQFLVDEPFRSHVLTAFWMPEGVRYDAFHDALKKRGFIIYAGQSSLAGRIFRISNLGDVSLGDLKRLLAAIESILRKSRRS